MNLDIEPIRVRLRRVDAQITGVETDYGLLAPRLDDYRFGIDPNEDFTEHIERIYLDWILPEWWAVAVGEIMHNLRATLDNLVWQLVLANDHQPGSQHEFPVANDEGWYKERSPTKLRDVPEAAFPIIQQVQPYKAPPELLRVHPLWIVHNLNRIDKHHLLHVIAAYPGSFQFKMSEDMAAAGTSHMRMMFRPLENNTEVRAFVTEVPFHGDIPVSEPAGPLQVMLMETDETPFYPFPGVLRSTENAIKQTVDTIVAAAGR